MQEELNTRNIDRFDLVLGQRGDKAGHFKGTAKPKPFNPISR
jgi:hypothetical protein